MLNIADITVQDFKDQFYRDFQYLPVWSNASFYNYGDIVYYDVTKLFYSCKNNGVTSLPTNTTDWSITTGTINDYIQDIDITKAYVEARQKFNYDLTDGTDEGIKLVFLYLAAHYLVSDLKAGGTDSQGQGLVGSRSVGSVSESYVIPEWQQNAIYSFYTSTYYGSKYINLVKPYTIGNVLLIRGG